MKTTNLLFIFLLSTITCIAQSNSIFTNTKSIDDSRYAAYKGSPYLFDEWLPSDIYDAEGKAFEDLLLNFNIYTNEIEIRKDNQYIELDKKFYTRIEVQTKDGIRTFQKSPHSFFKNKFVELIYQGANISFVKKARAGLTEKEMNDVGKTIIIKRFEKKSEYYFIKGEKLDNIKFKKKSILAYLGHKKEIESFLKKNKLKINSNKGIQKALAFYEKQGY